MKKILLIAIVFVGMGFASCGNKTVSEPVNDTTAIDSLDTLATDSDSVLSCDAFFEMSDSLR